ncbi:MAG: hypothetical protein ACXADS_01890 [Candidatus Thorarchaeota archaeon]
MPVSTLHLTLRFLLFGGLANTLGFTLEILESLLRTIQVVGGIGITFLLPVTTLLITIGKERYHLWGAVKRDALCGFLSLIPLAFLGLFLAYFDASFTWFLYLPLAPMVGCSLTIMTSQTSHDGPII